MNNLFLSMLASHPDLSDKYFHALNWLLADGGSLDKVQSSANSVTLNVVHLLMGVSGGLAGVMYAWGGMLYQTGSQENIQKGKKRWVATTVGFCVVIAALTIVAFVHGQAQTFS